MPNPTAAEALELAAESGDVVTLTDWQGNVYTGTPAPHPTEPGVYRILTGRRGRPALVHRDDVEEVCAA